MLIDLDLYWHIRYAPDNQSYYAQATQRYTKEDGRRAGRSLYLHVEIMKRYINLDGKHVDHKNHDTLNNKKKNLRVVEQNNNLKHRKGKNSNNKSGYRNVCWIYNAWVVQLNINGKNTRLGKFDDVHEAGKFAEKMRKKYYGEYAGNG